MHLEGQLELSIGQASCAGIKSVNEDCIGIRIPQGSLLATKGAVAVIADGVSAAEAGKEASETCVQNFLSDYFSTPDIWTVKNSAHQVLTALNRWLYGQGQRFIDAHRGYVSTMSTLVLKSHTAHIFHVGDSRVYRLRDGELEQLTSDHATRIADKSTYLTRAMGLDVRLEIDYRTLEVDVGDVFLLTTDGVHDFLGYQDLKRILMTGDHYDKVCQNLIDRALEKDSNDNLSCQIIRVDQLPLENADDIYQRLTELPFPPALEPGMILDGYRIEKEIHASSRSQLYIVSSVETGKRMVMKTPSVNFDDDPAYIERFILESWIGRRIQSVNVVKVIEPQGRRTCLYYLLEHVNGMTLSRWIKEHPKASVQDVMYLVEQIVRGLRAFHRRETLHQDIKPDNILIDKSGVVKIIDFGSCLVAGIAEIKVPMQRDIALGTETYSAPDFKLGQKASVRSDLFSLAVIIFEMLTGKQPFEGKLDDCQNPKAFQKLHYVPSYQYNPLVPVWFDGALKKALNINAALRYQDVSEFLHDLQHPNAEFMRTGFQPLIERNPVRFWQLLSALLLISQLVTLVMLFK